MKICYIGDGGSIHNHFMVEWFVRRGHDVLFLTDTPDEALQCEVRTVVPRRGWGPFRHLLAALRCRRIIRSWKPDIVHAHNVTGYGYWGALAGFKPLVMTAWGSDLNILAKKNPMIEMIVRATLRASTLITADAEALRETALELTGENADVRILQWGVDLTLYDTPPDPAMKERFRDGADFVFLSTRRLRPLYRIDTIVTAFSQALSRIPNCRLVIVGSDHQEAELHALVEQLGISDRVSFTGWITNEELTAALLSADAFVSVPMSDSTALSLLEAFAARLPVIVSDLPPNHEWIESGKNGMLVTPGHVESLRDAMIELADRRAEIRQWAESNRRMVEDRGDREKEMRRLEAWYRELL